VSLPSPLSGTPAPLAERYDAVLLDLDGVVYLDDQPVPKAAEALREIRKRAIAVTFVTNNAAHTPADVVNRLTSLGIAATETEVMTSSMAAADLLREELSAGSVVLVVGGQGLWSAVATAGLKPVAAVTDGDMPAAVAQGWGPDVGWASLAEATVALRAGARWVATNLDRTLPSPRGPLPGSGSLIAAVETATGRSPDAVAGKPYPPLFAAAVKASHAKRPLVIGDRLDTDIAGATRAGLPSLLVLTGVSRPRDLLAAPPEQRPTYIGRDLTALFDAEDDLDELRALALRAWSGELPPDRYDEALQTLDLS
jgi:glycerol-1-phosphatase